MILIIIIILVLFSILYYFYVIKEEKKDKIKIQELKRLRAEEELKIKEKELLREQLRSDDKKLTLNFKESAEFVNNVSKVYLNKIPIPDFDTEKEWKEWRELDENKVPWENYPIFMIKNDFNKLVNKIKIKIECFNDFKELISTKYWEIESLDLNKLLTIPRVINSTPNPKINNLLTINTVRVCSKYKKWIDVKNLEKSSKYLITIDKIAFYDGEVIDYSKTQTRKGNYDIR